MQNFLMGLTLFRAITAGIPLFSSGPDFIKAMQGQGKMNLPDLLHITPVVFDAQEQINKAVTAESKVFSIYSDGVVPGYQRKTRVRIHAVVDFRNAPPPQAAPTPTGAGVGTNAPGQTAPPTSGQSGTTGGTNSVDAILAATTPDPGGTIVYYRME